MSLGGKDIAGIGNTVLHESNNLVKDGYSPSFTDVTPLPSPGGKGGVVPQPTPTQYAAPGVYYASQAPAQVGGFDNTGRIVDQTLLAQQAMLNRQPVPYQPMITPNNYADFYRSQINSAPVNTYNFTVPDYRNLATQYKQEYVIKNMVDSGASGAAQAASDAGGWGWDSPGAAGVAVGSQQGTGIPGLIGSALNATGLNTQDPSNAAVVDMGPTSVANGVQGGVAGIGVGSASGINAMDAQSDAASAAGAVGVGDGTAGGVSGVGVGSSDGVNGMDAASDAASGGDGGGGGGGGKIICTAMNHHYGFGSFRNAIWIAYADKHLTKAHEVGYHTIFLPLVDFGFKRGDGKLNVIVRKIMEWGTRHRSTDLRAEMRGGKRDTQGRIIRFIFEPLCYAVGKLKGY